MYPIVKSQGRVRHNLCLCLLGTGGWQGHVATVPVVAIGDGGQLARIAAALRALRSIVRDTFVQVSERFRVSARAGLEGAYDRIVLLVVKSRSFVLGIGRLPVFRRYVHEGAGLAACALGNTGLVQGNGLAHRAPPLVLNEGVGGLKSRSGEGKTAGDEGAGSADEGEEGGGLISSC